MREHGDGRRTPMKKEKLYGTKMAPMDALGKLPADKVKELAAGHCKNEGVEYESLKHLISSPLT